MKLMEHTMTKSGTHAPGATPPTRSAPSDGLRGRLPRWLLPVSIVLLFVASAPMASATSFGTPHASIGVPHASASATTGPTVTSAGIGHPNVRVPTNLPHSQPTPLVPHPAANSSYNETGRASFFSNAPIPNPTLGNNSCSFYSFGGGGYHYCYNSTTEPSLNLTTQGYTGLAYTAFTNNSPCTAMSPFAMTEVGFVVSTDFGYTWSSPMYLGNPVCSGVPDQNYSSAFQPSLTSLSNGTFVLSYVDRKSVV